MNPSQSQPKRNSLLSSLLVALILGLSSAALANGSTGTGPFKPQGNAVPVGQPTN